MTLLAVGWVLLPVGAAFEFVCFAATRPGGSKPVWSPLVGFALGLIGLAILLVARYLVRQGKRHLSPITTAQEVLDGPPFVLYLRTFTDDPALGSIQPGANLRGTLGDERVFGQALRTEEEQLRVALRPFGPMVAVGRPGERLPEVGARRLYLDQHDWQDTVLQLMAKAGDRGLVLMGAGRGAALRWELAQAVALVPPSRLVLLVPLRQEDYQSFRRDAAALFPASLPDHPAGARLVKYNARIRGAVYFDEDWTPHFVRFDTPRSPGNFQRVIESRFVYGLRPVYERLGVPWPGVELRLPTHMRPTRRQVPLFVTVLGVPLAGLGFLGWTVLHSL
ncbi:hypothetical protein ACFYZE_07310 [Streptomyces sp. NPDC001796]|uniref:hypothetical protein n=1 Tax=Streptomyces sp. NPDC001796 TaxID=3364609 RepID=UPI0036A8C484